MRTALPVVLGRRWDAVAVVTTANLVGGFQLTKRFLDRSELRVRGDVWMKCRRDVLRRTVNALHVLQQTDDLCDRLCQRMLELLREGSDLRTHLRADVVLDEVVDLVESDDGADRKFRQVHGGVDEQLLRKLDDGSVRAADVLARAALCAQARDHLDDEVDLVRQQRIEVDEAVASELGQLDVRGEASVLHEPAAVLVEELSERSLGGRVLREHAAAGHLGDVRRFEMDLQRETVHQAGKLDLLVVEAADELAKLFLRRDHNPVLAAALYAEALHHGLQIEHLLHVARDKLANFIDDEHQALARAPTLHQLVGAISELPGTDI